MEFLPPGGDLLVSCSRDQTIKIWDTGSGFCLHTLKDAHKDWIRKVSVNAAGTFLASASKDETVIVWNIEKIKGLKGAAQQGDAIVSELREHTNQVDCVRWAPLEACHAIDASEYNRNYLNTLSIQ